jgi:LCP family protein required for cell wall assembly
MAHDFDVFQGRQRVASVDGFLSGAGQSPRRPAFRAPTPDAQPVPRPVTKPVGQVVGGDMLPRPMPTTAPLVGGAEIASTPMPEAIMQPVSTPASADRSRRRPAQAGDVQPVQKPKKPKQKKSWGKRIAKTFGLLVLAAVLFFGGRFAYNIAKATGSSNPFAVLGALQRAPLKNDNGRVNILVAGNSADDAGHGGADLTDSIMILSMDTRKKTALMLSVPRDMWVKIPGYGHSKINAAYTYGGMDKLKSVIEDELDVPIHYTVLVNYTAFKDLVDAVGGITITINSSDKRGIYDSSLDWTSRTCCALAKYPNGPVTLNGKQALNLARARGEGYGSYGFPQADFTRTEHQRQMLLAIREKALKSSTIANPIKVSNLVSAIGNNVTTDIETKELQSMFSYAKEIDANKIDSYNINTLAGDDKTMLQSYNADGQSALIPAAGLDDYSEIAEQIQRIFTATPVTKEAAKVVVLNGTDAVGLAKQQTAKLTDAGMNVVAQGNATVQQTTTIVDMSEGKKPNTLADLKKRYSATVKADATLSANYPNTDFIVVLGQNVAPKTTTSTSTSSD